MDLVDEEDDISIGLHLVHQALDAALKLAPELGARHQGGQVQQLDLLVAQLGRDLPPGDAQGQALGHGGFAHAGLADEAGVVLGPAGKDLHHPLDLLLPADDVVQLAVSGFGGQIGAEVLDMLALLLVEVLFFLLDACPAVAAVFSRAAPQHLVHRQGGRAAGGEQVLFLVIVVVQVHQLGHLGGSRFQLLVGDAHFLHNIIDRLDAQLSGAHQAEPLGGLAVHAVGNKHNGRPLFAACTHQHGFRPF